MKHALNYCHLGVVLTSTAALSVEVACVEKGHHAIDHAVDRRVGLIKILGSAVFVDDEGIAFSLRAGNEAVADQFAQTFVPDRPPAMKCLEAEFDAHLANDGDALGRPILVIDSVHRLDEVDCI